MENEKKSNVAVVGLIIGAVIIIFVFGTLILTGAIKLKGNKSATNNNTNKEPASEKNETNETEEEKEVLTEKEALKLGTKLYDKATIVYETWQLLPYCGLSKEKINSQKVVEFGKASRMYESEFKDLDELKAHLATFLSEEIINQHIKEEPITDLTILDQDNKEYTDYVITNNKLYCRINSGKGWLSRYLDSYDIQVNNIKDDIIIFDIKSANVYENVAASTSSKCTYGSIINDCTPEEIEYVDTKFIIEKINKNWVVTDYTLHN